MYRVALKNAGIETSCLGMGCASLGSRVSGAVGTRALERAWDAGLRWFDVAPAYGAGQAEEILGQFLKTRGSAVSEVGLCTKVGLLPPPQSGPKRLIRATLRPVMKAVGPLRAAIRRSGATANRRVDLTPDLLRISLEQSLKRLGVEQVALYALHNAQPEDMQREDLLRVLENLVTSGKARTISVAGDADAARAAALAGAPFGAIQLAHSETQTTPDPFEAARRAGLDTLTHSVFGVSGALADLQARMGRDKTVRQRLEAAGFTGPDAASAFLLARARAVNSEGVVLVSMLSNRSLMRNLPGGNGAPRTELVQLASDLGV